MHLIAERQPCLPLGRASWLHRDCLGPAAMSREDITVTLTAKFGIAGGTVPLDCVIRARDGEPAEAFDKPNGRGIGPLPPGVNFAVMQTTRVNRRSTGVFDALVSGPLEWYRLSDALNDGADRWVKQASVELLRGPSVALEPAGVEPGESRAEPLITKPAILLSETAWCSRVGDRFDYAVRDLEHGDPHPASRKDMRFPVASLAGLVSMVVVAAARGLDILDGDALEQLLAIPAIAFFAGWRVGKFLSSTDTRVSTIVPMCPYAVHFIFLVRSMGLRS